MLDLSSDAIDTGQGYEIHQLVRFRAQKQFVLIKRNFYTEIIIVGHYDTKMEATSVIEKETCDYKLKCKTNPNEAYTIYCIIDLSKTIPFFLGTGKLRNPVHRFEIVGEFYGIDTMPKKKRDFDLEEDSSDDS